MHLIANAADVEDDEILAVAIDQAFQLADHFENPDSTRVQLSSCPGLSRASTPFFGRRQDVDGRA
jgi:hypothetical protein